jgi:hypothetical protein
MMAISHRASVWLLVAFVGCNTNEGTVDSHARDASSRADADGSALGAPTDGAAASGSEGQGGVLTDAGAAEDAEAQGDAAGPWQGPVSCSNITGITRTIVIPLPWQTTIGRHKTNDFGEGDAVVFRFTPPLGSGSAGKMGWVSTSPTNGGAYNQRTVALSDVPCDFSRKLGLGTVASGQEPILYFSVDGYPVNAYGQPDTRNANLTPGKEYFLTVVQQASPGAVNTCTQSPCNIDYAFKTP